MALVLALAVMNGGCLLIPKLKDRIVELAVAGTTVVEFVSSGSLNTINESKTVNVMDGFDLAQILSDAGIDVSDVKDIAVSGVEYRVTIADPEPSREIQNGTITIDRNGSGPKALVSGFTAGAGAVSGWQGAPLAPSGAAVAELNAMLDDIRTALPGVPASNLTTLTYRVTGTSFPGSVATNFTWEMKVKITITGTVDVSVPT
jgi:hypothetical protein